MISIIIDSEKCKGADCKECIEVCSENIFILREDTIYLNDTMDCNNCEYCADTCPEQAIRIKGEY